MTLTTIIILNAVLASTVIAATIWLLAQHGIRKGVHHDLALIRRRAVSLEKHVDRKLAA